MSYVIPAILMGMVGRGGLPEDEVDILEDLATYPIASFVFFGRMINAVIKGYGSAGTIIDVPFNEFKKAAQELTTNDPDYGKVAWQSLKGTAAMTGKVPQAVFNAVEAISDEDTRDPRRLIWTEGQLKRKDNR